MDTKWENGEDMRFTANETLPQRLINKELGQIKYHLHKTGTTFNKIKIKWDENSVEVNKVQVAWVENENEMQYTGEAERVKDIVKQYMKNLEGEERHRSG